MGATNSSTRITGSSPKSADDSVRAPLPQSPTSRPMPIFGDQPTVISSQPPLPVPNASASAHRILEGRIMPGDHLGHFELLDYVGGGGMGRVFRASDTRLARIVALKVLSPEQAADAETVQRFQNEAQSAARLDHENIARVHYVGEDRGIHFIAFEFVEGVNIRVLVEQRGPLPLEEAVSYTLQVAEALAHADERHVVHRDIKPSNVIITPEGRVKLIDMGLARLRQLGSSDADLTASGVTLGTFDYISPEQARDPRNADTRSDIYSLGCTLFFMLAGRPPFLEGTVLQKLLQHQSEVPPDVCGFRADLPEESDVVLKKMLAKEPQDRHNNARELAYDLLALSDRLGLQPSLPGNRAWLATVELPQSFWLRHVPWMASLVALAIIVLGLEIFWTVTTTPENLQAPRKNSAGNLVSELPLPIDAKSNQSPIKGAEEIKSSPKKMVLQNMEHDTPLSIISGTGHNADNPPSSGHPLPGLAAWNANSGGNLLTPYGHSNAASSYSNTAAAVFQGKNLETGQPFVGATANPSAKDVFPLDTIVYPEMSLPLTPANHFGSLTSSANAAGKFDPVASSPDSMAKKYVPLVVSDVVKRENEYTSLSAACAAAHNGDTIELRYNGPREEKPLLLPNSRLTICAGEGYSPVVVFRPHDADPAKCPRGMFTLRSGRLSLKNLVVELIVPPDIPAEKWSLFEIHGGQMVRLDRCLLTIQNAAAQGTAYHPDTAFFRVQSALEMAPASEDASAATLSSATLEIVDTMARGEAVFLRSEDLAPANLRWENGLLITSESLLFASGGTIEPKAGENLYLTVRHVTAAARAGLCRLVSSPSEPFQLNVRMNCTDNIFLCSSDVPMIQQEGVGTLENIQQQLAWSGDLNFYDRIELFWTIRRSSGEMLSDAMTFGSWLSHWGPSYENQPMHGRVAWKRVPSTDRPAHLQTMFDYALNREHIENPAVGAASDGSDAGVQAGRLPGF